MLKNNGYNGGSISNEHDFLIVQKRFTVPLTNPLIPIQPKGSIIFDPSTDKLYVSDGKYWSPLNSGPTLKSNGEDISFSIKDKNHLKLTSNGILLVGEYPNDDFKNDGNISHFQGNIKVCGDVNASSIIFDSGEKLSVENGQLVFMNKDDTLKKIYDMGDKSIDEIPYSIEDKSNIIEDDSFYKKYYNTFVGKHSLENCSGDGNTAMGYYCLHYNTSSRNSGFGAFALQNSISGTDNVGIGYKSLFQNEIGSYNTSVGSSSFSKNKKGMHNTCLGYDSLEYCESGNYNVSIGANSLKSATFSDSNIAIGVSMTRCILPGIQNIGIGQRTFDNEKFSGSDNIAIGTNSGKSLEYGTQNISIGPSALDESANVNSNIAIGANSLGSGSLTSEQISIGVDSMLSNISGEHNTSIGTRALSLNVSGSYNIAIGNESLQLNKSGNDSIAIGVFSSFSCENGSSNISIGKESLQNNKNGNENIAIGKGAGCNILQGNSNIFIGNGASSSKDVNGTIVLGNGGCATSDNQFVLCGKFSGTCKLESGEKVIYCENVTLSTGILLTAQFIHGVPGFLYIYDRIPNKQFTIKSSSQYDESIVFYFMIESQ